MLKVAEQVLATPSIFIAGPERSASRTPKINRRDLADFVRRGPPEGGGWEFIAWYLSASAAQAGQPGDAPIDGIALTDHLDETRVKWFEGYSKRWLALLDLAQHRWFQWFGADRIRHLHDIVAGDDIPLQFMRATEPPHVLVTGAPGTFAGRMATWMGQTLGLEPKRLDPSQSPDLENPDQRCLMWFVGQPVDIPWWSRVSARANVITTPTVRELFDTVCEGARGIAKRELYGWLCEEAFSSTSTASIDPAETALLGVSLERMEERVRQFLNTDWWDHAWPGNFDELQVVLTRACFADELGSPPRDRPPDARHHDISDGLDSVLDDVRRRCLQQAWREQPSAVYVATRLRISRQTATKWIERYRLRDRT